MEYSPANEIENDPARYQLQQSKILFARASKYYGSKNIKHSQTNFSGARFSGTCTMTGAGIVWRYRQSLAIIEIV